MDACRYFAGLLVGALGGVDKETLLSPRYCPVKNYWDEHPLRPEIAAVAHGSFHENPPPANPRHRLCRPIARSRPMGL